ncbi:unnamed protein product, partial [Heterosigma akashiwo]
DVACIGELLIDFVALEKNKPLSEVPFFACLPGGAPANVAVALQRLGALTASFVGKVGNDPFGDKLLRTLEGEGVTVSNLAVDPHARTTVVFDGVWEDGRKDTCFYRGADTLLRFQDICRFEELQSAACVHYGSVVLTDENSPTANTQQHTLHQLRKQCPQIMMSYDPNYRPSLWSNKDKAHAVIFDNFKLAHLVKISEEEFEVATGHCDFPHGIQAVLEEGVELVVVSRGRKGAIASNGQCIVESPGLGSLSILETTGAGDAFMAALISKLLPTYQKHGSLKSLGEKPIKRALDYANVVGGLACTKRGAIPALPYQVEVEQYLGRL